MNRVLLDTDILSEIIKGRDQDVAAHARAYLNEHRQFTTSAVSVAEIVYGLRRVGREDRVIQFVASLAGTQVLAFDESSGLLAGRINADLERRGLVIGMPDVMIAAIALGSGLPLVTGNLQHFGYVRAVGYDLAVETWRASR